MDYITTTQLRTHSSRLIELLKKGIDVSLIHRSKIVGTISHKKMPKPLTKTDINRLKVLANELNLPKISYKEREKIYRAHLEKKYGKHLS